MNETTRSNRALVDVVSPGWLMVLLLTTGCAGRIHAADLFTPEHVTKIQSATRAVVSPDGSRIAYTVSVPRRPFKDKNGANWTELHMVGADGVSRPYVSGHANVGSIAWTPDGRGVSFLIKRGEDKHRCLYVIPADGGEARNILTHTTGISSYSWSPDGMRVAFLARRKDPLKEKKEKLSKKGFNAEIFEEDLRFVHVWIGTPNDEDAEPRMLELPGSASELHWSPTGDRLVIALAPTPLIDDHYMKRKVHVVDVDSGEIVARFDNPGKIGPVALSPDGKHLAMISAEDLHDPAAGRLLVASTDGGSLRDVLENYPGHVTNVAWQSNKTIMFLGDVGVWTTVGRVNLDGSDLKTILPVGEAVLSGLSLSRDGQTATGVIQSPKHPGEVFMMEHAQSVPRRLTDSNPWMNDLRLARQEVVSYPARDGLRIEGLLVHPLDEKAGQRYPLILHVHGGPESHNRNGWLTRYSAPGQVGAAQGYAVFYPNYRGSTGRGVKFSKMGQADYAGKEFDDLVDAIDHLVKIGLVDRDRVGVTGGSYGGFATAWCSTALSQHFKAGVMFVGISDHISKSGSTDIPNEMVLVHARKRLIDDWQFFLTRSPIYHVEKGRTPLLIMHGKEDTRVHPSQSLELYRQLKILGNTPVRLVWYPGEGHGNRKSAGRYDFTLRMMRWFDHYLKGSGGDPPAHELAYPLAPDDDNDKDNDKG